MVANFILRHIYKKVIPFIQPFRPRLPSHFVKSAYMIFFKCSFKMWYGYQKSKIRVKSGKKKLMRNKLSTKMWQKNGVFDSFAKIFGLLLFGVIFCTSLHFFSMDQHQIFAFYDFFAYLSTVWYFQCEFVIQHEVVSNHHCIASIPLRGTQLYSLKFFL